MSTNLSPRIWAQQSGVSDPGAQADWLRDVPSDITAIRRVSQELVVHYTGATDGSFIPIRGERLSEVDLRYAEVMLGRLRSLGEPRLHRRRTLSERIVGCCRDFSLLFVTLARAKGIPARFRVGYAAYFTPGWPLDHVIAEVWDAGEERWRLVEPEVTDAFVDGHAAGGPFNPLDVPPDRFLTGPEAWIRARAGRLDPERCVVAPDFEEPYTRGWSSLRVHVVHDLAALARVEMLLWDQWGLMDDADPLARAALLDAVARDTVDPACPTETIAHWLRQGGLAIPETVTSYSPAWDPEASP
jgi:hypothetical protein